MKAFTIFFFNLLITVVCAGQLPNKEMSVTAATGFLRFIDSLCTLKGNCKKLIKNNSGKFHIEKTGSYKTGDGLEMISYFAEPVHEISKIPLTPEAHRAIHGLKRMNCKFSCILKNKHSVLVKGYYTVMNTLDGPDFCDTFFLNKLESKGFCRICHKGLPCCAFGFSSVNREDAAFLSDMAAEDSIRMKSDYIELSTIFKIFKSKPDFYEDMFNIPDYDAYTFAWDDLQATPRVRNFYSLYINGKYKDLIRLMHSANPVFNWFLAEALHTYNARKSFLTTAEKDEVERFNGINGPMFRPQSLLNKLYPSLIETITINNCSGNDTSSFTIRRSQLNSVKIFVYNNIDSAILINSYTSGGTDVTNPNSMDIRRQQRAPFFIYSLREKDILPTSTNLLIHVKAKSQECFKIIKLNFEED